MTCRGQCRAKSDRMKGHWVGSGKNGRKLDVVCWPVHSELVKLADQRLEAF